ncbi:MAG: hypothetical protein AB1384_12550 [Actinomycetota bacterium]
MRGMMKTTPAPEFIEGFRKHEFTRQVAEYIDDRVQVQVEEAFRRLFAAKEEYTERSCLVCGASLQGAHGRTRRCPGCRKNGHARAYACWTFLMERFPPVALRVIEMVKEEGKWSE